MSNRTLPILLLGLCLVAFGIVRADAQSPATFKIGVVDLQRTLKETNAGKAAKKKLEADKAKKQRQLDARQKKLQQQAAELQKQKAVLKPDVLRKRQAELEKDFVELQETYMKLQQELAQMEAKLVQEIFRKASPAISNIAKQRGLALVVEKNEGAVLYSLPALDITNAVNKAVK
jgi:outer membrane protein